MKLADAELIEKLKKELEEYKRNLALKSVNDVIEHSYETAVKSEIVNYISSALISEKLNPMINNEKYPLDYLYGEYMKSDDANLWYEIENLFMVLKQKSHREAV